MLLPMCLSRFILNHWSPLFICAHQAGPSVHSHHTAFVIVDPFAWNALHSRCFPGSSLSNSRVSFSKKTFLVDNCNIVFFSHSLITSLFSFHNRLFTIWNSFFICLFSYMSLLEGKLNADGGGSFCGLYYGFPTPWRILWGGRNVEWKGGT